MPTGERTRIIITARALRNSRSYVVSVEDPGLAVLFHRSNDRSTVDITITMFQVRCSSRFVRTTRPDINLIFQIDCLFLTSLLVLNDETEEKKNLCWCTVCCCAKRIFGRTSKLISPPSFRRFTHSQQATHSYGNDLIFE